MLVMLISSQILDLTLAYTVQVLGLKNILACPLYVVRVILCDINNLLFLFWQ